MKFVVRDDDTCALTRVEELESCYADIYDSIPVCLSVTPFRMPGVYPGYEADKRNIPQALETNPELVAYLRQAAARGRYDFAMHGYHHVCTRNDPVSGELAGPDYNDDGLPWWKEYRYSDDLQRKTRHGKSYLEKMLGSKISTFVPPGNALSRAGLDAIISCGMNIVGVSHIGLLYSAERPLNPFNTLNSLKRKFWKLRTNGKMKYPYILDFKTHKEVTHHLLYPSADLESLKRAIDNTDKVDGVFVLGTHYHSFSQKIKSGETIEHAFRVLCDYAASKKDAKFVTYRQLWD